MVTPVENSRLYMPAEDTTKPEERTVIHPETNIDQVLVDAGGTNLRQYLGEQIILSSDQPERDNGLWLRIVGTRVEE